MSRPTKLTPEVHKRIIASMLAGNYKSTACGAAGVSRAAVNEWEHRGAAGEEPYATFADALKKAEDTAERRLLKEVRAGGDGWQSKAWIMERRWPSKWGGRIRATVSDERESLLAKVKAHPEVHERLRDILGEEPTQGAAAQAH